MKKIITLILALAMVLSLAACGGDADRIAQLEAENEALKAQVAELTARLERSGTAAGLTQWEFTALAWEGGNGATVRFTALPESFVEGQTAQLSIWLEGERIDTVQCQWDGTAYTASTDLNAADGYCYYCTITQPDGMETEVELNTPKNPTYEGAIYLETALNAYCAMMVEDSTVEGDRLTITAGYVQVQLPLIGRTGEGVSAQGAKLMLKAEGQTLETCDLPLTEGGEGLLTGEVAGLAFALPELQDDQQLELWLEVALSDGQTLFTTGGSWYYHAGELFLVVG